MNRKVCIAMRILFAAVGLAALACKGSESPPTTGTIRVTSASTGTDLDPDGYIVTLQGDTAHGTSGSGTLPLAVNGTVTFSDLKPGGYFVGLGGAAANCPIVGDQTRMVTVTAGGTAQVTFQISCIQHVDLTGVWNFTSSFGSPLACNDTGSFVLSPNGEGLGGTDDFVGTCDQQDGSINHSLSSPATGALTYSAGGAVSVTLTVLDCSFSADVAGTPPDHLTNGSIQCSAPGTGTWTAVRGGGAVTSLTVSPATRSIVAGATARLRAIMIDASGSRRVGPAVTWTSDAPATASVDPSGLVTGVASGSATIAATAESKSSTATVGVGVVTFSLVQSGAYHACGLTTGGAVYCWGHGAYGQIGDGGKADAFAPESVLTTAVTAFGVGAVQSCAITTGGAAACWGSDLFGALGAGATAGQLCASEPAPCSTTPVSVVGGHTFSSITSGWEASCALEGGAAYCWGDNTYGILGDGSTTSSRTPIQVTGNHTFVSVGAGNIFACGLTDAGTVYCWGNNTIGELGIGPGGPEVCGGEPCSTAPVAVLSQQTFKSLSVGYWHACAVTANGAASCWGDNGDGQLGASTTETCTGLGNPPIACSTIPVPVGGPPFASVSAGSFHTCGVDPGGAGYCWGFNGQGQLGNGTTTSSSTPVSISGGLSFATVTTFGRYHSCGLTTAGIAYCWGDNTVGQLGDGTGLSALAPVQVAGQAATSGPAPIRAARMAGRPRPAARPSLRLSPRPPSP